jgi:hypothetical protein
VLLRAVGKDAEARVYLEKLRRVAQDPADRAWAEEQLAQ